MLTASPRRYYVSTSVWQFLLSGAHPEARAATEQFLQQASGDRLLISDVVLQEVSRLPDQKALLRLIAERGPELLRVSEEARKLADRYLLVELFDDQSLTAALHLAMAVTCHCDVMVSWDFQSIVKPKTRRGIKGMSHLLGYPEIDIISPHEAFAPFPAEAAKAMADLRQARCRLSQEFQGLSSQTYVERTWREVNQFVRAHELRLPAPRPLNVPD